MFGQRLLLDAAHSPSPNAEWRPLDCLRGASLSLVRPGALAPRWQAMEFGVEIAYHGVVRVPQGC